MLTREQQTIDTMISLVNNEQRANIRALSLFVFVVFNYCFVLFLFVFISSMLSFYQANVEHRQRSTCLLIQHRQVSLIKIDIEMLVCINLFDRYSFTNNSFHTTDYPSKWVIRKARLTNIRSMANMSITNKNESNSNSMPCMSSAVNEQQCLVIEPDRNIYFHSFTRHAHVTLTNHCSYRIVQFQFLCTKDEILTIWPNTGRIHPRTSMKCFLTLQTNYSRSPFNVHLVNDDTFAQLCQQRTHSVRHSSIFINDLHPRLSHFQVHIQWRCLSTSSTTMPMFYRKLFCFVIAKRSTLNWLPFVSSSIERIHTVPCSIAILIALIFGIVLGRCSMFYD
jgi:hypothetical protein